MSRHALSVVATALCAVLHFVDRPQGGGYRTRGYSNHARSLRSFSTAHRAMATAKVFYKRLQIGMNHPVAIAEGRSAGDFSSIGEAIFVFHHTLIVVRGNVSSEENCLP